MSHQSQTRVGERGVDHPADPDCAEGVSARGRGGSAGAVRRGRGGVHEAGVGAGVRAVHEVEAVDGAAVLRGLCAVRAGARGSTGDARRRTRWSRGPL